MPLSRPVCGWPAGWAAYMKRHTVAEPTALMAMGMKTTVLAAFSALGVSRSARVATSRPTTMQAAGTTAIHSRVLNRVCRKAGVPRSLPKLSRPTKREPSLLLKLLMTVMTVG